MKEKWSSWLGEVSGITGFRGRLAASPGDTVNHSAQAGNRRTIFSLNRRGDIDIIGHSFVNNVELPVKFSKLLGYLKYLEHKSSCN